MLARSHVTVEEMPDVSSNISSTPSIPSSKMKGLWSISVPLLGESFHDKYAVGRISIDIVFLCAIVYARARQPRAHKFKNSFDGIRYGTDILLFWYVLSIIDLFLHEARIKAPYGYLIFDWFLAIFKFASDISILAGAHWVISRQLFGRVKRPIVWLLAGDFLVFVLVVMTLYYLGSLLANQVLWLEVGDPDTISLVFTRRNQFEAAFAIIQCLTTLLVIVEAAVSLRCEWNEDGKVPKYLHASILASLALWVRAVSEMTVVVRYHFQQHPPRRDTALARDTVYGLFTFIFLLLIFYVHTESSKYIGRPRLLVSMEDDLRRHIVQHIRGHVTAGKRLPALQPLFNNLNQNPTSALSAATARNLDQLSDEAETALRNPYVAYVKELETKYGKLEPVSLAREY